MTEKERSINTSLVNRENAKLMLRVLASKTSDIPEDASIDVVMQTIARDYLEIEHVQTTPYALISLHTIRRIIEFCFKHTDVATQQQLQEILRLNISDDGRAEPIDQLNFDETKIEDINSFLSSFRVSDFTDQDKISAFLRVADANDNERGIADGGAAAVFAIPGTTDVVKINRLQQIPGFQEQQEAGSLVYKIPFTPSNKTLIIAPNYITEILIGRLISSIQSPSFVKIKQVYLDLDHGYDPSTFLVMERLSGNIEASWKDYSSVLYFALQMFQALSAAQLSLSFVHGDMWMKNVMIRRNGTTNLRCYEVGNGNFIYTYFDYDNVITDFGFSRCETTDFILNPSNDLFIASNRYVFNPHLDVFTLLVQLYYKMGCALFEGTDDTLMVGHRLESERRVHMALQEMMTHFFGGQSDIDEVFIRSNLIPDEEVGDEEPKRELKYTHWWRCDPAQLYQNTETRLATATDMFNFVVNKIEADQMTFAPDQFTNEADLVDWLQYHKFYVSKVFIDCPQNKVVLTQRRPTPTTVNPYFSPVESMYPNQVNIDGVITVNRYDKFELSSNRPSEYNLTLPASVRGGQRNFSDQHFFVAAFNQTKALNKGYTFRFDCCNVDPQDYFKSSRFSSGIVVNSVFFDMGTSKAPIGYYKTRDLVINNPIPELYKEYYAFVGIEQRGRLEFIFDNSKRGGYEQVLAGGAMIVKNGRPVFTKDEILKTSGDKFLFLSALFENEKERERIMTIGGVTARVVSANHIKAGEFNHAGNPNPRMILGISNDGETVYLIRIEGRDNRGVGLDFIQLGEFCMRLGLHHAINLDGGRSAQMCWKLPGDNTIHVSGESLDVYPVGGVLSLVKMK